MKKVSIFIFALLLLAAGNALSKKAENFEQAKTLSAASGIPILLEFVHDD